MNRQKILAALASLLLIQSSCNSNSVIPPEEDQPGRRDYEWTIDTINTYDPIYELWGSSPTNLWAATGGGNLNESIFHFDGINWATDGVFRLLAPHSLWGFSSNNVYIGGSGGKIWRYDGNNWAETAVLTKDGHTDILFDGMWGELPNDFYAFGAYPDSDGYANNSVIAHFTNQWSMFYTDGLNGIVERLYSNKADQKIYLRTNRIGGSTSFDSTLIYEYSQGKFSKIYSSMWARGLQADISLINREVYFVLGSKISKRMDSQFQTVLEINNPNFYQHIWGKNSKDIFLLMTDGLVHYNGSDMEYLFHFNSPTTRIFEAVLFEKDVFFLVYEYETTVSLSYHGKLK